MYVCAHLSINSLLFINANQGVHYTREIIEFNYILNKYLRYSLMCVFNSSHHTVQDFLISLIRRERKKRRKSRKNEFLFFCSQKIRESLERLYISLFWSTAKRSKVEKSPLNKYKKAKHILFLLIVVLKKCKCICIKKMVCSFSPLE